ncbi:hypothetical protein RFI_13387, partial [Reticulomyxa filosa]
EIIEKKNGKQDPGSMYELAHVTIFVVSITCWNLVGVFETHPRLFIWIENFIFSGLLHRLIVADVTKMKTKKFHNLLLALPIVGVLSLFEYMWNVRPLFNISMNDSIVAYVLLVHSVLCWSVYVSRIINEICDTLQIRLLFLTSEQLKKVKEASKK